MSSYAALLTGQHVEIDGAGNYDATLIDYRSWFLYPIPVITPGTGFWTGTSQDAADFVYLYHELLATYNLTFGGAGNYTGSQVCRLGLLGASDDEKAIPLQSSYTYGFAVTDAGSGLTNGGGGISLVNYDDTAKTFTFSPGLAHLIGGGAGYSNNSGDLAGPVAATATVNFLGHTIQLYYDSGTYSSLSGICTFSIQSYWGHVGTTHGALYDTTTGAQLTTPNPIGP